MAEIRAEIDFSKNEEYALYQHMLAAEHPDYICREEGHTQLSNIRKLKQEDELVSEEILWFLADLKDIWSSVWRTYQEDNSANLSARFAVRYMKDSLKDEVASYPDAIKILESEIKKQLPRLKKLIGIPVAPGYVERLNFDDNGHFVLDGKAIQYFEENNRGAGTKKILNELKAKKSSTPQAVFDRRDKWDLPLHFHRCLALALWDDYVREIVKESRVRPAALIKPIFSSLKSSMTKGAQLDKKNKFLLDDTGKQIARVETPSIQVETVESILKASIPLLNSITAQKLIRWQVNEVNNNFLKGIQDPRRIVVEGGWPELANLIGFGNSGKARDNIRKIVYAQAHLQFKFLVTGRVAWGNLLTYLYIPGHGRNKRANLSLTLGEILCPNFSKSLPKGFFELQEQKKLVPLPLELPPVVGRQNEHVSQVNFHMEILLEMRKGARDLVINGGILLNPDKLKILAEKAMMPNRLITRVMECWLKESVLEQLEPHIYSLGQRYANARALLLESGKQELLAVRRAYSKREGKRKKS